MQFPPQTTDESLMARFRRRLDGEAFAGLVSRFLSPALGVARQILSDACLAEDAVQEAFLRVVRSRRQYRPSMAFSSWFYAILRNVCTDMLRRQARQGRLVREAAVALAPSGTDPPRSDLPDAADLLAGLDRDARAVLTLRIVEGLAFREVAAALGLSEEAAKKRAQRALRRLRQRMAAREQAVAARGAGREGALASFARPQEDVPDAVGGA